MTNFLILLGLSLAGATLATILWSIAFPAKRIWPPKRYTVATPILVWVPTFSLFGVLIFLGIMEWGKFDVPLWLRYGAGLTLIGLGNIAVWNEVRFFGIHQTGGAQGTLRTEGLYRFSRNPQYVADMCIVLGWIVLSASPSALIVGLPSIVVLIAAPFAEEPWLRQRYGKDFDSYASKVRRFF